MSPQARGCRSDCRTLVDCDMRKPEAAFSISVFSGSFDSHSPSDARWCFAQDDTLKIFRVLTDSKGPALRFLLMEHRDEWGIWFRPLTSALGSPRSPGFGVRGVAVCGNAVERRRQEIVVHRASGA